MGNPFEHGYYNETELRSFGFKSVGENVRIAKNCTIIGLENISLGNNVRIDSYVTMIASLSHEFTIESFIHISPYSHICGSAGFVMQDFSGFSAGVKIFTRSDDYTGKFLTNPTVPAKYTHVSEGKITIGRHAIFGSGAVVLPSVSVGDGCAVGALSLVRSDLDPWSVYFGSPAKRIGSRSSDLLHLEQQLREAA